MWPGYQQVDSREHGRCPLSLPTSGRHPLGTDRRGAGRYGDRKRAALGARAEGDRRVGASSVWWIWGAARSQSREGHGGMASGGPLEAVEGRQGEGWGEWA